LDNPIIAGALSAIVPIAFPTSSRLSRWRSLTSCPPDASNLLVGGEAVTIDLSGKIKTIGAAIWGGW